MTVVIHAKRLTGYLAPKKYSFCFVVYIFLNGYACILNHVEMNIYDVSTQIE